MNTTKELHMLLPGKKFTFNFVVDITHDDLKYVSTMDDDFAEFLNYYWTSGLNNNTLLLVMGDHGPRFANTRKTINGKLEERLPFLSIVLPETLKKKRPNIDENLKRNVKALTTPHDLYATILDAIDLREHWNPYKVKGSNLTRGLSLFEPIPKNRTCSEAGIEPFWCSCLKWDQLSHSNPLIKKAASSFIDYINNLNKEVGHMCFLRYLVSIDYMSKLKPDDSFLNILSQHEKISYKAKIDEMQTYQIRLTVGPGEGIYEASVKFDPINETFTFRNDDVSRINAYGKQPSCIIETHPHLNKYCYCKN